MAITARLELKQGQSLVMTPQLLQAIKLLQLSHLDLQAFVEVELERNPLLERADADDGQVAGEDAGPVGDPGDAGEGDWSGEELAISRESIEGDLGTRLDNVFQDEAPSPARQEASAEATLPVLGGGSVGGGGSFDEELPGFEASLTVEPTLREHLAAHVDLTMPGEADRLIARHLVDAIDDNGYLAEPLPEMAERLGVALPRLEKLLAAVQRFEPTGVGARDLAECLALQLAELDRLDPAMRTLLAHLPLLARRDFAQLQKLCGVDAEDMAEMAAEIRRLDPKPGRAFASGAVETVIPDVIVRAAPDGSWLVDLNPETLPRVLVNQTYHARISAHARSDGDRAFIADCLQTANWLTRSLEQRARTILKVASEIVRHQDAFFAYGVEHLRPLNLRTVADAVGMHESTVSRVTSNKYLISPRGLYELKYFFTASIAATGFGEAHSAEAVRHRIKGLIDAETPDQVMSDDAIVARLRDQGVDIARRTVAKYRESMGIASSMERRRAGSPSIARAR